RGIRTGRPRRRLLVDRSGDVSVNLVRRDLHQPNAAVPCNLGEHECAEDVGACEVVRSEDGAVDVRFGGEVDDRIEASGGLDVLPHADVAAVELGTVWNVRLVPRLGELVEHDHLVAHGGQAPGEGRCGE